METTHPARDLTDPGQNRAVLDAATALLDGASTPVAVAERHGPAVAVEAAAAAASRHRLGALGEQVHIGVVWAMYGETGRMVPRTEHPHGEDFVRAKVAQLDWLTADLPVTWSILACDDGCPDSPSSADVMAAIATAEGYPASGHRSVGVIRLADVISRDYPPCPALGRLTSTDESRKGGAIVAALSAAAATLPAGAGRQVLAYTDADLSANLAQLGSLAAGIATGDGVVAALGQRYGTEGAVLVKADGPWTEPRSTGDKPDKIIVLFRHFVRALLVPALADVPDTQAGFKAFDPAALTAALHQAESFNETFDVELLVQLAQHAGAAALAVEPIVFTEDFAATNFPSVDPGPRHLAMVQQVIDLHDRLVAPVAPATGDAADLLDLVRNLELAGYIRLIEALRAEDADDPTLFDRRWPISHLRTLATG
jgi:hypothetical protein